jgi:glycosyltransferase involved in cell wall biosynthesis
MTPPAISVAVITRDRAAKLKTFLDSAAAITSERPWELVVVDNGSTDETSAILKKAGSSFPVPLRVVRDATPGVARARNRGWQAASGPIVVFTNDDCLLPGDYVDRYVDDFAADDRLAFVAGSVIRHDPEDPNLGNVSRPERWHVLPGVFLAPGELITANMAFRRDVLESIGGFDEVFAYGNGLVGDDADAVARVTAEGWHGLFDPEIVVRHHHGKRTPEQVASVVRGYAAGRGAFYAKCLFDRRLRRLYLKGWLRMTAERIGRRESLGPTLRELGGAARYVGIRLRGRFSS